MILRKLNALGEAKLNTVGDHHELPKVFGKRLGFYFQGSHSYELQVGRWVFRRPLVQETVRPLFKKTTDHHWRGLFGFTPEQTKSHYEKLSA